MNCINCGTEIEEDDAVYSSGGMREDGLDSFLSGEEIGIEELFDFEDGPYCTLDCSLAG